MTSSFWRRYRFACLAIVISALVIALQTARHWERTLRYDGGFLPGFDAYVYVAMAEDPAFFTLAPWGYRIGTPTIVNVLPADAVTGFRIVAPLGLAVASVLLAFYLRKLGYAEWASLAGVAAFGLAPSTSRALENPFLTEPLTLILEIAFLLALHTGARLSIVILLALLGTLTKEIFVLWLPAVAFVGGHRLFSRRAAARMLFVATPVLFQMLALRSLWTPHLESSFYIPPLSVAWQAGATVAAHVAEWWTDVLLGGIALVAVLGAMRRGARPYLRDHAYLLAVTSAVPFAASVYVDSNAGVVSAVDASPGTFFLWMTSLDS